jgi:hypothetical protein
MKMSSIWICQHCRTLARVAVIIYLNDGCDVSAALYMSDNGCVFAMHQDRISKSEGVLQVSFNSKGDSKYEQHAPFSVMR